MPGGWLGELPHAFGSGPYAVGAPVALLDCGTVSVAQARAKVGASVAQFAYLDQWSQGPRALWRQCRFVGRW